VQARYEQLVKSGATAISSDMLFGENNQPSKDKEGGRWSTPAASMTTFSEKISDHIVARASFGSNGESIESYKQAAKETAGKMMEKGQYVASGAYSKAS